MNFKKHQKGQMLLMVILVMVVALTVGLSIASRTITNVRTAKQNETSQRAFQAAQGGIDLGLKQNLASNSLSIATSIENGGTVSTTITKATATEMLLNGGNPIDQDVGYDIWFQDYTAGTPIYFNNGGRSFRIYYSTQNQNCTPTSSADLESALEVIRVEATGNPASPYTIRTKVVYDTCARIAGSSAPAIGSTYVKAGETFTRRVRFATADPITANTVLIRVIPLFNSTKMAIDGCNDTNEPCATPIAFPSQGKIVESSATVDDTVRKIYYFESLPQTPAEIFQYAIMGQN